MQSFGNSKNAGYAEASLYASHEASSATRPGKIIQYFSGHRPDCTAKLEAAHAMANRIKIIIPLLVSPTSSWPNPGINKDEIAVIMGFMR